MTAASKGAAGRRPKRTVLIGAGRMGSAMARAWVREKSGGGAKLSIVEPHAHEEWHAAAATGRVELNPAPALADVLVLAIKPQSLRDATADIAKWVGPRTLVISILAGVTMKRLSQATGSSRIVRAMPNTPGSIGKGVTAFSATPECTQTDVASTRKLLGALGEVVGPLDEGCMDAVTAVSGSGPAYVFLLAEALEAAGRSAGLPADIAARLARATVSGSGLLLADGETPTNLRKGVTSPNGTTAAALDVLMGGGAFPDLMRRAVDAAARRSAELSRES
jgi:pyrroline-5-carboxylate reductase